jgi:hypothetical protein
MQNISSPTDLKEAIRLLEIEQLAQGKLLKEQFHLTYESLKPVSLLKSTLKDFNLPTTLIDNILGTTIGLATGYLSKKIVVGTSSSIFRKLIGSLMQVGIVNTVSQHPDAVKSIGQFVLQYILHKKETNSNKE